MSNDCVQMKITFMGGKQAGFIGLITLLAARYDLKCVVAYDEIVAATAKSYGLKCIDTIKSQDFDDSLKQSDLLVCVHGREIVPDSKLSLPVLGGINIHPCLYKYRGANPVGRLLRDKNSLASVGAHRMTNVVDGGDVIVEQYINVEGLTTQEAVYNALYPLYSTTLLEAIKKIAKEC